MTSPTDPYNLMSIEPEPINDQQHQQECPELVSDDNHRQNYRNGGSRISSNSSAHSNLSNHTVDNLTLTTSEDLKIRSFVPLTLYSIIIALGGFVYGYDIGTIGGIVDMPAFVTHYANNGDVFKAVTKGMLVSISCLGGFSSGIISSQIIPRVGMRFMISFALCIYSAADLLILFADSWKVIVVARVFNGMAFGCLTITCPMYISEITPIQYRGIFTCFTQLFITIGIVVGAITVYFTSSRFYSDQLSQFQYPLFQGLLIAICCSVLIWIVPESPKWLVCKSRPILKVKKSLGRINNIPYDDESIVNTTAKLFDLNFQNKNTKISNEKPTSIRRGKPKYLMRTLTGIILYGFQQYTGINFFFFYGLMIFQDVGLRSPYLIPVIFGSVNLIFSLLSIFLVSYFNRKTLLLFGSIMMAIFMLSFTLVATLLKANRTVALVIISCSFISTFSITWGPVATIVISEMYPPSIKVKAMSICGSCSWIFNFSVALMTPTLSKVIGLKIGYGFTLFTFLSIFFIYFYVPETRGVNIRTIDSYYEHYSFSSRIGAQK